MCVCESVNKLLLTGREHNCASGGPRSGKKKTAHKCKHAHKATWQFIAVYVADDRDWSWKGISWFQLRFRATNVSPFFCQDVFFGRFPGAAGRRRQQPRFLSLAGLRGSGASHNFVKVVTCSERIKSYMWGIKSSSGETCRPELKCVSWSLQRGE